MSISINANVGGTQLAGATLASPQERQADSAMAAQNGAAETQSEGLKPQRTQLDVLLDKPSVLDRFAG